MDEMMSCRRTRGRYSVDAHLVRGIDAARRLVKENDILVVAGEKSRATRPAAVVPRSV